MSLHRIEDTLLRIERLMALAAMQAELRSFEDIPMSPEYDAERRRAATRLDHDQSVEAIEALTEIAGYDDRQIPAASTIRLTPEAWMQKRARKALIAMGKLP